MSTRPSVGSGAMSWRASAGGTDSAKSLVSRTMSNENVRETVVSEIGGPGVGAAGEGRIRADRCLGAVALAVASAAASMSGKEWNDLPAPYPRLATTPPEWIQSVLGQDYPRGASSVNEFRPVARAMEVLASGPVGATNGGIRSGDYDAACSKADAEICPRMARSVYPFRQG